MEGVVDEGTAESVGCLTLRNSRIWCGMGMLGWVFTGTGISGGKVDGDYFVDVARGKVTRTDT